MNVRSAHFLLPNEAALKRTVAFVLTLFLLLSAAAVADPVTVSEALNAASRWVSVNSSPLGAKLGRTIENVETYKNQDGTDLYYVVNLRPEGYVIVSADDMVEPIVAFSPEGRFDPSPQNPLYSLANRDIASRIAAVRNKQSEARRKGVAFSPNKTAQAARAKWTALLKGPVGDGSTWTYLTSISDPRVDRFIFSKWGQTNECAISCYNYYTPPNAPGSSTNYPCGCVATAMAQLMRYWQHPTAGVGTTSYLISVCGSPELRALRGGDGNGGPYDWANMVLDPDCSTTTTQRQALGSISHDAGVAVGMDYCSGGSGISDLMRIVEAFKGPFQYSEAKLAFDNENQLPTETRNRAINANLHAGYPVLLAIIGSSGGHVVVCDGYGYNASTMYHHLNMGWGGSWNAWYNLPTIDSSPSFNTVAGIVYNVYRTGTGEIIAGRVTDPTGNPIAGAIVRAGSLSAVTNVHGVYAITNVASATQYTVTVEKPGYAFTPQVVTTGTSVDNTTQCGNLIDVDFVAQLGSVVAEVGNLAVPEGGTASFGVKLSTEPPGNVVVNVAIESGDSDITIESGASLTFTTANWNTYQPVVLCAAQDEDGIDGTAVVHCSATEWTGTNVNVSEADDDRFIVTDVNTVTVNEGSTASFSVRLAAQPAGEVVVNVSRVSGDADISIQSGSILTFGTTDWNTFKPVVLFAAEDEDYENGSAVIRCNATGWVYKDVTAIEHDSDAPPDTEPPTVPTDLAAFAQSQTSVKLTWTASTDNTGVAGYRIYRDGLLIGTSTTTSYSDNTCTANTTYSYRVSAYDGNNNESEQCVAVNVTTFPYIDIILDEEETTRLGSWADGQPAAPPLAYNGDYKYAMSASGETAWAKWTPNIPRPGNWAVYVYFREGSNRTQGAPYTIYYNGGSQTVYIDQTVNGGQWVYLGTKPFLAGSSGYVKLGNATFETSKVIVADAVRFSFVSAPPGTDNDPPSVPTNLTANVVTASHVDLQWSPSTDNVAVGGYKIYRDGLAIGTTTDTVYSDTACHPSTTYHYSVSAYDTSGNESPQCTPVEVTTSVSTDIILDEEAATYGGSWLDGSYGLETAYNGDFKWTPTKSVEDAWVRWTPTIPTDGNYHVYIRYVAGSNRSSAAPFRIYYRGGSQLYLVNQTQSGGQWILLDTKPFLAGTSGYIRLGNAAPTGYVVVADAVRFTYAGPLPDPPPTPTDLMPVVNSPNSITWQWNDVTNETGYRVKDINGVVKSGDLPAGSVQWTETGLTPNTYYARKIYAFNSYGESNGSIGQGKYTLAQAGESTDGTGQTGNVWCTNAQKNTWYGPGKTFIFSNPAGFGTDGTWKASRLEYKWNKNDAETWSTPGTSWTSGTISVTADEGDGYYYLHVRAFNGEDVPNNVNVVDYGPFLCDLSPPSSVEVTDEGSWTPSQTTLRASWTASTDGIGSDINRYEYAIGTTATSQDVRGWTSVGTDTSVVATGLSLNDDVEYFVQVRAVDNVGLTSEVGTSDGITVAPVAEPISAAWARPNLVDGLSIRNKVVTAALDGAFWLEEADRSAAIKVISSATVAKGDIVSVAGMLGMLGTQRVLFASLVENHGRGTVPAPVAMVQRALGGSAFNSITPGVTGGIGLYNIGLLVRCWGTVTYSDSSDPNNRFFCIDDGSGLTHGGYPGVLVRCGSVLPPSSGIVSVTGVIGSESDGGRVVPVILIRDAADIVTF